MIDLKQVIVNSNGEPMKQNFKTIEPSDDGKGKETTVYREVVLKDILKVSLLNTCQEDTLKKTNDKEVVQRYQLWRRMHDIDKIVLEKKEKKLLKKLIYQHYEILVAGQAIEILN